MFSMITADMRILNPVIFLQTLPWMSIWSGSFGCIMVGQGTLTISFKENWRRDDPYCR